jgi:hypothetical protein
MSQPLISPVSALNTFLNFAFFAQNFAKKPKLAKYRPK